MNTISIQHILVSLIAAVGLAANGQCQSFLTEGLVAYYPFSGNASDATGNGHNGDVVGATLTTDRFGNAERAYLFGGTEAYITASLNSTVFSGDFTVSVWFNATDYPLGWHSLLCQENESFYLVIPGSSSGSAGPGHLIAYSSTGSPAQFGWFLDYAQMMPTGTYCQAVVTKSGTDVTMYLNSEVAVAGKVTNPTMQPGRVCPRGRSRA